MADSRGPAVRSAARAQMGTNMDGSINAFFGPRRDGDRDCLWEPPVISDRDADAAHKLWQESLAYLQEDMRDFKGLLIGQQDCLLLKDSNPKFLPI